MKQYIVLLFILAFFTQADAMSYHEEFSLHVAASRGDALAIKRYIENGQNVDKPDDIGRTALMQAALCGRTEIVEELLNAGANPNIQRKCGATALFYSRDYPNIFRMLLQKGADPNLRVFCACAKTVLMVEATNSAIDNGTPYKVALLLKYGSRTDLVDSQGKTAIDYASNVVIKKLLSKKNRYEIGERIVMFERKCVFKGTKKPIKTTTYDMRTSVAIK